MNTQGALIALPVTAIALLVSGCATGQSREARVSERSVRCLREFGPSGKVPPVVTKCAKPSNK